MLARAVANKLIHVHCFSNSYYQFILNALCILKILHICLHSRFQDWPIADSGCPLPMTTLDSVFGPNIKRRTQGNLLSFDKLYFQRRIDLLKQ